MNDYDIFIGIFLGFLLGFLICFQFLVDHESNIYEDLNCNYGKSNNCFEKFDKLFCELGDESIIEVKTYEKE